MESSSGSDSESYWQCDQRSVKERNAKLLECSLWTDCTFKVGKNSEEIFRAHKLILASASPMFEKMFFEEYAESKSLEITVDDIEGPQFKIMLNYIYTDHFELNTWQNACALVYVAEKYLLDDLLDRCIKHISAALKPNNALQIYEFSVFYDKIELKEKALEIIQRYTSDVIKSPYFEEIKFSTFMTILEQEVLNASQLELFNALNSLATLVGVVAKSESEEPVLKEKSISTTEFHAVAKSESEEPDTKDKSTSITEFRAAVKKIYFLSMKPAEFAEKVAFSQLLLPEEALAILSCLNQPMLVDSHYPAGFKKNGKKNPIQLSNPIIRQKSYNCNYNRLFHNHDRMFHSYEYDS